MRRARRTCRWSAGVVWAGIAAVGCGTYSLPRVAANGTTILIPVPDGFAPGFGRILNQNLPFGPVDPGTISIQPDPTSTLEDFQRGELLFALRFTPYADSGLSTYFPVRYITRVQVDEASSAALPAAAEGSAFEGTSPGRGQVFALVDIPRQLGAGTYYLFIERWKRNEAQGFQDKFVKAPPTINSPPVDWQAWAGTVPFYGTPSPSYGMMMRIVESSSAGSVFNDALAGYDKITGYNYRNFTQDLERLVPRPKLRIWMADPSPPPGTQAIPSAWEFTIRYPTGKIEVLGVELGAFHRSGALVSVSPAASTPGDCAALGTAKISAIDPDQKSAWVNVVYRLLDFTACGRAEPGDFTVVQDSYKAYDADGNVILEPYAYLDNNYSFLW